MIDDLAQEWLDAKKAEAEAIQQAEHKEPTPLGKMEGACPPGPRPTQRGTMLLAPEPRGTMKLEMRTSSQAMIQ